MGTVQRLTDPWSPRRPECARANSSAKNGLPPDASVSWPSSGRGKEIPSRAVTELMERRQGEGLGERLARDGRPTARGRSEGKLSPGFGTAGEQQTEAARQPPERERESLLGGRVEPLKIVDRDEHGLLLDEDGKDADERGGRRSRWRLRTRFVAQESRFERTFLDGRGSPRVSSKAVPTRSARAT